VTDDLLGFLGAHNGGAVEAALARIVEERAGVFSVIERPHGRERQPPRTNGDYGIGAQILVELGVRKLGC
jgi:GTP cyclohydrolase II